MSVSVIPGITIGGVGESVLRPDGTLKVQGQFAYSSDLQAERMLFGATLRSPHPHARIRSIEIGEALAAPGVAAVLTHEDVPGRKTYGLEHPDQPVLAWDEVRYQGEAIALVAADHPETARRAAALIVVEYEVLPVVDDPELAMLPESPILHPGGNLLRFVPIRHGDSDLCEADVIVEGEYEVGMQDQAFLGPESGLAIPDGEGGVDLFVATQWLHVDRDQLALSLGLEPAQVRVTLAGVGGAFGAREDLSMQIHACLLALHTDRPVKLVYGREESFFGHVHRHPARMQYRHGATREGKLVFIHARIVLDGGAYASSSGAVVANAACFAVGPYICPNASIDSYVVYTDNPPCGAMRGFGAVQTCFAYESQMDRLAAALELDPIELRLRNAMVEGSRLPTGQAVEGPTPVAELLERLRAMPLPDDAGVEPDLLGLPGGVGNVTHGEGVSRGVGYGLGFKNIGFSEGFDDYSTARVRLSIVGSEPQVEVHTAAAEVGQGLVTIEGQIARTELGVARVVVVPADTHVGSAGSSSASRQTWMTGGAVKYACDAVRERVLLLARERLGDGELVLAGGEVRRVGDGAGSIALAELLGETFIEETFEHHHRPTSPLHAETGQGDAHLAYAYSAHRAVVDVDRELGLVRVVQIDTVQDVGKALNPQAVEGQIEGGTAQGLGLALMEEIQISGARLRNPSFTDYLIPTILDMPPVRMQVLELGDPLAPYGAKGVGEPPTISSTPAIVSAVRAATGVPLVRVPVRPDDIVFDGGQLMLEGVGRRRLIDVARGDVEPDLVIENARVFSVFTKEWLELDVAVADGRVAGLGDYPGGQRLDARGRYLVPGFIDAHVHIESSKLMVDEFARAVLAHGTTAVVADPHEIANVLGTDGIHWLLDVCDEVPLDVWVMASSCVPASRFESPRRPLSIGDLESVLRRRHALGVAEMMNFPAVIAGDPDELRKLTLRGATHADGHAPGVRGRQLDAYLAAGIRSDHESTTYEEALEKRRKGAWILIREASNARNLKALLPLVREFGPERCAFCTDDREPDFLVREGHIDQMCRVAIAEGVPPEDALLLASLHPALYHGLVDAGAIAPGYRADLVLLDDLVSFRPTRVYKDGRLVYDGHDVTPFPSPEVPVWVRQTVHAASVGLSDLRVPSTGRPVRVIEIVPEQLLTLARIELPTVDHGVAVADPARDLAKIAVVERHHATGRVGVGFVRGFGLQRGAFATTVAHDAHNIVCVGVDDDEMALAIARLAQIGGGIVVHDDGDVRGELPLPVAGLLSDQPAADVVERLETLERLLAEQGVGIVSPFMSLSFLALSVIPSLKITDLGLIDVDRFEIVPLTVERVSLAELNGLDRDTFVALLDGIFEHSPWVTEAAFDAAPFAGVRELEDAFRAALAATPEDQRLSLVRAHPDLAGRAALAGELTPESTSEQASARLDRLRPEELAEFTRLNDAYQARFGFPFVVCVREHTIPTMLEAFARRLDHRAEAELDTALEEVAKIASLRLHDRLEREEVTV